MHVRMHIVVSPIIIVQVFSCDDKNKEMFYESKNYHYNDI